MGVPSVAITRAASRTVSASHGPSLERRLGGVRPHRGGRHAAETDAGPHDDAVADVEGDACRDARDVVEASLGDLVECRDLAERERDPDRADELAGTAHGLPVAGEVPGQRDHPVALGRGQDDLGVEGQQDGCRVTDGGGGGEVAAQRRAVADEARGELRKHAVQQRDPAVQGTLDLAEAQGCADLDDVVRHVELTQLGDAVDPDDDGRAGSAEVDLDAPVGRAGDEDGIRVVAEDPEGVGQVAGALEDPAGALEAGGRGGGGRGGRAGRQVVVGCRACPARTRRRGSGGSRCSDTGCHPPRAGRSRWVRARGRRTHRWRRGRAVGPVVLRRHRAHEAGRAVAALRAAPHGQLVLHGVQVVRAPQSLGRDDLLAVERRRGDEAGVDGCPAAADGTPIRVRSVGTHDHDRARPALALGAALLGAGEPCGPQEVERGRRRVRARERTGGPVDRHHVPSGHPCLPSSSSGP